MNEAVTTRDLEGLDRVYERPSVIKRLRDHHHLIARLVAMGVRTTDVAAKTGMSISRVSILKGDPAFSQLVEMYRMNIEQIRDAAYEDIIQKEKLLLSAALDWKIERYEDSPDDISPGENNADMEFAQGAVFGKTTKNLNLTVTEPLADLHERRRQHIDLQATKNAEDIEQGK